MLRDQAMQADHYTHDKAWEHLQTGGRPAPQCYSRHPQSKAIGQSGADVEGNMLLLALSIVTCAAAFLVVYGGWSF
jgi:hypothetical protein